MATPNHPQRPPSSPPRRKPITLSETPANADDSVPVVGLSDMLSNHSAAGAPKLGEAQSFELARNPRAQAAPTRARSAMQMQVVDWEQEKESLNLLLKTDQGVLFLAKVMSAILALRLVMSFLGARGDTKLSTFLHLMTQPLVSPFERFTQSIPLSETRSFETPAALAMATVFVGLGLVAALIRRLANR